MSKDLITTVLLCRHGETDWNLLRKFQGMLDIPLNDEGRVQVRHTGQAIAARGASMVWTSPLLRAHETARSIADACEIGLRIDERFRERDLGSLQGVAYRDVAKGMPTAWAAWKDFRELPPEVAAEPASEVVARMESGLFDLAANNPGATVAVVSHGAAMRCLLREGGSVGNASVTTIVLGPGRTWRLILTDDMEHLPKASLRLGDMNYPELRGRSPLPVTRLMLCRHGESVGNQSRKFQGTIDLPLDDSGRIQAGLMSEALRVSHNLAAVWTSPLSRASDTAAEIARASGLPLQKEMRLMERHLGKLQGMPFDEVKEQWPATWAAWKSYQPLPEEMNAEPEHLVVARLESVFWDMADQFPGQTVAMVVHGANGRCLLKRSIGNATVTTIEIGPGRSWRVLKVGDASHLPVELAKDAIKASKM